LPRTPLTSTSGDESNSLSPPIMMGSSFKNNCFAFGTAGADKLAQRRLVRSSLSLGSSYSETNPMCF
jgi:hypothetical protein